MGTGPPSVQGSRKCGFGYDMHTFCTPRVCKCSVQIPNEPTYPRVYYVRSTCIICKIRHQSPGMYSVIECHDRSLHTYHKHTQRCLR